jgi:phosphatidylserine/phosphatidylglycerophosphate/cardiolipin synthase-like enzyme
VTKRAARKPPSCGAEIHYGPGEDLERIDVALIREAAKQIDMAAYVLTDRAVIEALRQASARGVKVRIRRDASEAARLSEFDVEAQLGGRVPGHRASVKRAWRRTYAPEGLLRGSSPPAHRLGQFQPVRRDAPGHNLVALRGASVCAGFDAKFNRALASG